VVFTNEDHVVNTQYVNAEVTLYRNIAQTTPSVFLPISYGRP
jgi:hypothetical protein